MRLQWSARLDTAERPDHSQPAEHRGDQVRAARSLEEEGRKWKETGERDGRKVQYSKHILVTVVG